MYRWMLGVALLLVGGLPVLIGLWIVATNSEGDPLWGALLVAAFGLPALLLGGYLVRHALKAERQAANGKR